MTEKHKQVLEKVKRRKQAWEKLSQHIQNLRKIDDNFWLIEEDLYRYAKERIRKIDEVISLLED